MARKAFTTRAIEFLTKPFHDEELLQAIEQAFVVDREMRKVIRISEVYRGANRFAEQPSETSRGTCHFGTHKS